MIYLDDAVVKIGGVILPGTFKSIEVSHNAKIEEEQVEGSSAKPKQADGYEDADIKIELALWDSADGKTKEEKLRTCQTVFKSAGQDNPLVHELVSVHTTIRGIKNVIIKNMTSKETNKKDEITVSLELMQYDVITITASKNKTTDKSQTESNLSAAYQNYVSNDRGGAPKKSNKTSQSPAVDG